MAWDAGCGNGQASEALATEWRADQYLAYLASWSASQRFLVRTGVDAVASIADAMTAAWGGPHVVRTVTWPLHVQAGRRS